MRMAANQLLADALDDIFKIECPPLASHVGVHDDMKQEVAELLAQIRIVRLLDRFNRLVALFDQGGAKAFVRLLTIPWTASGRAKPSDDFPQAGEVAHLRHARGSFVFR
jgi:hypothetical protein